MNNCMSTGSCLCGSVKWRIGGTPDSAYHCHCFMCRKAHGAAFGTYYYLPVGEFQWTSETDAIREYKSSRTTTRYFCGTCGSVVPNYDADGEHVYVPAGCHDDGPRVDANIFVGSRAPWHEITDDLPRHQAFPPGQDQPVCEARALPDKPPGILRGSCLCGAVAFEVNEPFKVIYNCFCTRCRQARAAAFTTNGFTSFAGVRFVKGEERLSRYKHPEARYFTQVFCDTCGSGLPRLDPERNLAVIPLGALDDDPGCRASDNIFVRHKAGWYDLTDSLPTYEEGPPG